MNVKQKIELSRLIVEKTREINEVLEQAKKEGLTVDCDIKSCLYYKITRIITYADSTEGILGDESVISIDKTQSDNLIIKKLDEKEDELNEMVRKARSNDLKVHYQSVNPLNIKITEILQPKVLDHSSPMFYRIR